MKYHLGCGSMYLEGYVNVDFPQEHHTVNNLIKADIYADLMGMPLERCSEIRSSHVFEHFNYIDSFYLLYKWFLAIEVQGQLIIKVPDAEALSKALSTATLEQSFRIIRYMYGSHEARWAYHINGWTPMMLSHVLTTMGFTVKKVVKTLDGSDNFPNYSMEIVAEKTRAIPDKEVLSSVLGLFKLYKNGDTDFERKLDEYLQSELIKKL
jgi:predicted SAM-dependent methyltransferase